MTDREQQQAKQAITYWQEQTDEARKRAKKAETLVKALQKGRDSSRSPAEFAYIAVNALIAYEKSYLRS